MASAAVDRVASFAFYSRVLVFILQVCIRKSDIMLKVHYYISLAPNGVFTKANISEKGF